jgi:hypothetical protein
VASWSASQPPAKVSQAKQTKVVEKVHIKRLVL